ncbi:DNA adenine methylase [Salmonella enterica]|nr:DNA adenine methylase [Salmonella enterica]
MKKPSLIRSPLKWAGGKREVVPELRKHLPKAKYLIEPFVGGGSVFMNTDYDRYALCDSNAALMNFYQHLTYNTGALIDLAWKFFKDGGNLEAYKRICPDISFHANKPSDAVIYCDPPYLPLSDKDSFTHYNGKSFTENDHRALVAHLIEAERFYGVKSVISNSDTEATRAIYSPFRLHKLDVKRSVSASTKGRKTAPEVIGVLDGRERYVSAPRQEGKAFAAAMEAESWF